MAHDPHMVKNLLALKKRSFDVKFDLQGTDYTALENIGSGAYGVVCCAKHEPTSEKVAIKKIPHIFDLTTTAKRTLREIKILRHFRHENVISIREILQVRDRRSFKDVYVVLDLMESDLHRIIHSNQPLTEEHVRYFIYQLLKGLKYIHSANITHRDLKPQNLLVNENCLLKIGDFGMARGLNQPGGDIHHKQCMTQYVATRWYRAPELIMLFDDYTEAVDMWSTGCILAEMLGRKQIFPAKDVLSQLQMIIMTLGTPPDNLLERTRSDIVRGLVKSVKVGDEPVSLASRYPKASRKAIDMLSGLLVLDPNKRLTATQGLKHLFVNKYHDPTDEPICEKFDFSFEYETSTCDQLRTAIYDEIQSFQEKKNDEIKLQETYEEQTEPLQFLVSPENVFKVPNVIAEQGISTQNLNHLTVNHDIEMLSAKSTVDSEMPSATVQPSSQQISLANQEPEPSRQPTVQPITVQKTNDVIIASSDVSASKSRPDLTVTTSKCQKSKTISEDTKALIKAALLQSTSRRKMSESGENQVKKPVTAQQRQKEREERRRKKSEAKSKRKSKDKISPVLTEEDRSMLERWSKLAPQKVKDPAPSLPDCVSMPVCQPAVIAVAVGQNTVVIQTQPSVLVPQTQYVTTQVGPLPVGPVQVQSNPGLPFLNPPGNVVPQYARTFTHQPGPLAQNAGPLSQPRAILVPADPQPPHLPAGLHHLQQLQQQIPALQPRLQFISPPKPTQPPLAFISPPKGDAPSAPLSYVQAAPKRSWTEAPLQASPGTTQSFLQTHSLLDQLNGISRSEMTSQTRDLTSQPAEMTSQRPDMTSQRPDMALQPPEMMSQMPGMTSEIGGVTSQSSDTVAPNRDPLIGQREGVTAGQEIPVICIDDSESDTDAARTERPQLEARLGLAGSLAGSLAAQLADPLADVTRQLSRSQVDDAYPPVLVSTPKGGAAGYGVGLDLDLILHEWISSQRSDQGEPGEGAPPESAPLSASALTDWLQVAGGLDPRDMADLQRELDLSPMVTAD